MYAILRKDVLSDHVNLIEVEAPLVARKARPGQFVIVRINETGERIPLTLADFNPEAGSLTLIFQKVGKSTRQMGRLNVGDGFQNIAGPLGNPSEIKDYGTVVVVGGGVGIAAIFTITRALKMAGNRVITILGARNHTLLFWVERIAAYSDQLIICTDDGSAGRKALVTAPLQETLKAQPDIARVLAIGPAVMMKRVSEITHPFGIPAMVSLNSIMIDGTGMCGGCRVVVNQEARFVCVDGPEFDGRQVDWDNLLARGSFYRQQEKGALDHWEDHRCRMDLQQEIPGHDKIGLATQSGLLASSLELPRMDDIG
jgi:ferredoxin/flavodoxin---NADP+ reductase